VENNGETMKPGSVSTYALQSMYSTVHYCNYRTVGTVLYYYILYASRRYVQYCCTIPY